MGSDYFLVREGPVYLAGCRVQDGRVKIRTTTNLNKAQLFKKKFAISVLEQISRRWSKQRY